MIADGETTSVAVTEAVLAHTRAVDAAFNAFAHIAEASALEAAHAADAALQAGAAVGPLHGVPYSVKDLLDVAGMETGFGSELMRGNIASHDAVAVQRLRAAGAVCIGKTTTPEFAGSVLTESIRHGVTCNPWDPLHTSGGSSGGAGVAVATGCAPIAVATDGAGSARIPASCCGVLGLKPTLGRIPHASAPDLFANFTHIGLMARSLSDLALMLSVASGEDVGDPWSTGRIWRTVSTPDASSPATNRIAELSAWYFPLMGNPRLAVDIADVCGVGVDRLRRVGLDIAENNTRLDWDIGLSKTIMRALMSARMARYGEQERARMGRGMRQAILDGDAIEKAELRSAPIRRSELYRLVQQLLSQRPLILSPVLSAPPPPADFDPVSAFAVDGEDAGDLRAGWFTYPTPFNLTGHPAIAVPIGFDSSGLPVALQAVAGWGQEQLLLDLAACLQQSFDWEAHWPSSVSALTSSAARPSAA